MQIHIAPKLSIERGFKIYYLPQFFYPRYHNFGLTDCHHFYFQASKQASLFDTMKLHLLLPFNLSLFAMHFWREKIIIIPDLSPTSTHTKIMVDYQSRVAFSWIWTFQFIQILRNREQYNFCVEFSTSVRKKVWFRCCTLKWKV